ncbi:hypothetical protein [Mesoterricola silvestris]|uniref:Uncharacterized protein n=1 Tax=Mesoterricola silvestris TaxID=2927979 RepID=A0AA48KAX4_9BACT|nr:hypothetical protein [Mesoterricola silvestris]BDU73747.1 hypothetical protein METEAL_29210 [Mesoterricola silvestris]
MLHPHVPDTIKAFGKHLFATFLGLVMALGLDNWNHERLQKHVAQDALASVLRETDANREALRKLASTNKDLPGELAVTITALESLQDARARRQPWVFPENLGNLLIMHTAGNLKSSAWNMALANQSVQRFPKAKAAELADIYQQLGRLQAFLDLPVDYTPLTALSGPKSGADMKARLERFSPGEIERLIEGLRALKVRFELVHLWANGLMKDPEKASS